MSPRRSPKREQKKKLGNMNTGILFAIDISGVTSIVGIVIYVLLALVAMWGGFSVAMVWMRVSRQRFNDEEDQSHFLDQLDEPLKRGDFRSAADLCADDPRATPQLALLALNNRDVGYAKVRQMVMDRFQRDVLADLDHRLNWVTTVIKSAPMLGLLGTVIGMMGAFGKLYDNQVVCHDPGMGVTNVAIASGSGSSPGGVLVESTASGDLKTHVTREDQVV